MRFYLSSYLFGSDCQEFINLLPANRKMAYIPNAGDCRPAKEVRNHSSIRIAEMEEIFAENNLDIEISYVDLKDYFSNPQRLAKYRTFWVKVGHVYVLREAMKRSGFDNYLLNLRAKDGNKLYAGYSAGVCVLAKNLYGIHVMDRLGVDVYVNLDADTPGVGILDYMVVPHYDSPGHKETELAAVCKHFMKEHSIPHRVLRDRETIILLQ